VTDLGRLIPENPLAFIRRCVQERSILWTYHVQMRLRGRSIPRSAILESAESLRNHRIVSDGQVLAQLSRARQPWRRGSPYSLRS